MLDADISTEDALRHLTVTEGPATMGRRRFLQLVGMGVGAGALSGTMAGFQDAWAGTPIGPSDGILVLVGFFGGLDGLNTVVPYTNGLYYQQHGNIAIPAAQVLPLNGAVGLHPRLTNLKSMYDRGEVAVVQGVGYPDPDLSHFSSMATWMYGKAGSQANPLDGWIGRWLDGLSTDNLLRAVSVGQGLPLHLVGAARRGISVPQWGMGFGDGTSDHDRWMYDGMRGFATPAGRGPWHDALGGTVRSVIDVGQDVAPVFARDLPDSDVVKKMTVAARLINADLGMRVVDVGLDGFDTHAGQPQDLIDLLGDFDDGLRAFFTTLDDRFRSRVTIMTYSEFGRTSWSNDSRGTDHGTTNNHFVIGAGVKGGLYGHQPSLLGLDRWDRMDFNVDFRTMYASVLDGWMGGGASTVLGGAYGNLGLFKAAPGAGVATGGPAGNKVGDFVPVTPARLYDSRSAPRRLPLGAGSTAEVKVTGAGGVPTSGVTAVVLDVTAVGATEASMLTVWPTGGTKPETTHVAIPGAGNASGLVTVKPGARGRVNVTNDLGSTHVLVDVVGYFRTTTAARLQASSPQRIIDTRRGLGGHMGALGSGSTVAFPVRGRGGVPSTAQSVVLNITVVAPTASGSLVAWPTGVTRPLASSLSFTAKNTATGLVIARIGLDGKVAIRNAAGSTHVVADVVGWFAGSARGRFTPVGPGRVLDTRPDTVSPVGPGGTVSFVVKGKAGVPAAGVGAVLLNVHAVAPTAGTNLTVWPAGSTRPSATTIRARALADTSGLVLVKPGTGGKVAMLNSAGETDLVVDVLGWFTA